MDWGEVNQAVQAGRGIKENLEKYSFDKALNAYSGELQKNPDYQPDFKSPDFNVKAYQVARMNAIDMKMKDQNYQKTYMDNMKQKIELQQDQLVNGIRTAETFADKDVPAALDSYIKTYNTFAPDHKFKISDDKKSYTTVDANGTEHTTKFNTPEDMLNDFRDKAKVASDPKKFAETSLGIRNARRVENTKRALEAIPVLNKDGQQALYYKGSVNLDTGEELPGHFEVIGGKPLSLEDGRKAGFMLPKSQEDIIKVDEAKAGISEKKAGTALKNEQVNTQKTEQAKNKAEAEYLGTKGTVEKTGTKQADINAYKKSYGVDDEKALDMIRADSLNKDLLAQLNQFAKDEMLDRGKPEDYAKLLAERDRLVGLSGSILDRSKAGRGIGQPAAASQKASDEDMQHAKETYLALRKQVGPDEAKKRVKAQFPNIQF